MSAAELRLWRFLRSEIRLVSGRRRNQVGLVVLAALPVLLTIAVKLSTHHGQGASGSGPDFVNQIAGNGVFVAFAALSVELTLFFPVAISAISGDAIAGEAHGGTLRYLLTVPAGRVRVLVVKYLVLLYGALVAVLAVTVVGVLSGVITFGTGPLTTLSGASIGLGDGLWRLLLSALYLWAGLAALAAVGLFISCLTEQPIAATVSLLVLTSAMWIADAIPQISWMHPWLLVDKWQSFADLMREPILTGNLGTGLLVDVGYALVFGLGAWALFTGKDITS
jgi:ABC-2 type transport system permease protein